MKLKNPFKDLTRFEFGLWLTSVIVITVSFALSKGDDVLTIFSSLIGVTALIFVAKGYVLGQLLSVAFSVIYGIISFHYRYYGETITYLGMTAPVAILSAISWWKNPYKGTKVVEVSKLTKKQIALTAILAVLVTIAFYFILSALGNENLIISTISIATSFVACFLSFLRSPYFLMIYCLNDIVLIVLWILASIEDIGYLPMIMCFVMFFANDLYGSYNWIKMSKTQGADTV
ncbi:MAG: nicotinamide mononucleotide transporter [Clostridia bacterium]|nr:nicotinamide mononucleotide transporter [Clostridia bacterium]